MTRSFFNASVLRLSCIVGALTAGLVTLAACQGDDGVSKAADPVSYNVEPAFPSLNFRRPVDLQSPRDGTGRLFVVEQDGRIRVFSNSANAAAAPVFLDISSKVVSSGERGLLGLAFDPAFDTTGYYYVYYSVRNQSKTRVSRFQANAAQPDTTLLASEMVVIDIDQPFSNHNGGQIAFGPDGYLFIALGDGGGSFDPGDEAQDRTTLLGSLLRIDVSTLPYSIPKDNPFAGNSDGYKEEIYAFGLRNPWRFSFDPVTSRLYVGDVGQNAIEEINIVESGGNYGWDFMEASNCLKPDSCAAHPELKIPVWEYGRSQGVTVTGGYVYRGSRLPALVGSYVYADYASGRIWGLRYDGTNVSNVELAQAGFFISSFGVDENGELYICEHDPSNDPVRIHQLSGFVGGK